MRWTMDKKRGREGRELIAAARQYCRMGLNSGKRSCAEIFDIIRGYYKTDGEKAKRLMAVCLLLLFLDAAGRAEERRILLWISINMGRPSVKKSLAFWLKRYAYLNFLDERTAYRRWNYIVTAFRHILERM